MQIKTDEAKKSNEKRKVKKDNKTKTNKEK